MPNTFGEKGPGPAFHASDVTETSAWTTRALDVTDALDRPTMARAETVTARAVEIRDRELAEALDRLERRGDLADAQAAAVEAMAERLTAGLVEPAFSGLDAADGDEEAARVALEMFGNPDR